MLSVMLRRSSRSAGWSARAMLTASVATAAATLAAPAFAGNSATQRPLPAGFVPFESVGTVRLGMDEKTVRARLGAPSSINLGSLNQASPSQLIYSRSRPKQSLVITFDQHRRGDPVAHIQASGSSFRTKRGIGFGSSRAAVRRAFPHLKTENGSLIGQRGSSFMEIDFFHGRVILIGLADTRVSTA